MYIIFPREGVFVTPIGLSYQYEKDTPVWMPDIFKEMALDKGGVEFTPPSPPPQPALKGK